VPRSSDRGAPDPALLLELIGAAGDATIAGLERLTGGANMETWSFSCVRGLHRRDLILRRGFIAPAGVSPALGQGITLATEARLLGLALRAGLPVPHVVAQADADHPLGPALVMNRVRGEVRPRILLRDERYAQARRRLAFQCGEALGKLHSAALEECPAGLRDLDWQADLDRLQALCDHFANPSPAHQLAVNWLREQDAPAGPRVLCHGDFRLGNLLVGEQGLTAVLDWELAHVGYPGEDLGYLCANVWRFGGDRPVGGFGTYRELLDGYRSVRDRVPDAHELHRWQLYAALGWGLVCLTMLELHTSGVDPGLERAAVGRRLGESEIDILLLLDEVTR
jgi:aminoglycoside phosphotransferase (APT) family kinase protein